MIILYFARRNRSSLKFMEEMFKDSDKYVYFIEDVNTHKWLEEIGKPFTIDPQKAMSFKSEWKALKFKIENKIPDCTVTEHEFIS